MLGELIHKKLQGNLFSLKLTFLYCDTILHHFKGAQSIYQRHPKELYLIHRTWRFCFLYIWDTFRVSWEHHVPSPVFFFFFVSNGLVLLTDLPRVLKIFFSNFSPLFALSWDIFYRPFTCLDLGQYLPHKFCYWRSVLLLPAKHSISDVIISVLFLSHRPVLVSWWMVRSFVVSNVFSSAQNC